MLSLMKVVRQFTMPGECAYLPARQSLMEYHLVTALLAAEYERLLDLGYRKFGAALFRPVCAGCRSCRPVRVDAEAFAPSRSQRRAWRRNRALKVRIAAAAADDARAELYNRYHTGQAARKHWPVQQTNLRDYAVSFVESPAPVMELSAWEDERLMGVVLLDTMPHALSAIYHYYDPSEPGRGLGTYLLVQTLSLAREMKKRWVHLGYCVEGSPGMEYKTHYRPCEMLSETGRWQAVSS